MVSAASIIRRLEQFEALYAPVVPNVIECDDEDLKTAIDRHVERYGRAPPVFIVVPTRCGEADLEQQEQLWAEQQRRLIADAKAERKGKDNELGTEHRTGEHRSRRIVNSGNAAGQPNEGVARRPFAVRTRH